jgi:tetratricopeptide (TPR) repeat protein
MVDELGRRFPEATLTRQIHLPVIDALLTFRDRPAAALDGLEAVRPYDAAPAAEFWPPYIRGTAYLSLKNAEKANREFQQILNRRPAAPTSMLYPLAMLGVGRAAALAGDSARARRAYDDFFHAWRDADVQLPVIQQARREYAVLR